MATIVRLKSGRWRAQVRRKGHSLSDAFLLRRDAEAWARRIEHEIDTGQKPAPKFKDGVKTVSDLITLHIADMKEVGKVLGRSKAYSLNLLKARMGKLNLSDLSREQIINFGKSIVSSSNPVVILDVSALALSPGIRTFQASLVCLFVLAGRMAEINGTMDAPRNASWRQEISSVEEALRATVESSLPLVKTVAADIVQAPVSMVLAAGPNLGVARYAAAKRIEASGLFAAAQDLEEWWHVERFAYPSDMPVIIIAPSGVTCSDAAQTALNARGLGRRVIAVCAPEAVDIHTQAHAFLPILGSVREVLAPLLSYPAPTLIAAEEALILGRQPFQQDYPEIRAALEVYRARHLRKT